MSAGAIAVAMALLLPFAYVDREDAPEPSAERIERSVNAYSTEGSVTGVEAPASTGGGTTLTIGSDVLFAYASSELDQTAQAALGAQLDQIPAGAQVTVEGHTDSRGGDAVNVPLSTARAEAVAGVLRASRTDLVLQVVGKASSEPAVPETDEPAMAKNRRVELSWAS
ncbi:OmpA family protein [Cellulomonas fengjieae]|uniref:OmpA family protein n=1 Tax=Cellulomonas fengjieae TaxID=2819978 RepID=A0ABS3SGL2_9CELL|nr:OmpA family protein [Cellulomonas fengjieae]MBO3084879.1 OmpA family protein [Cellulomonas fengjieae]MBO3103843.1 OmpA family protein [Cellulomonas fengjieae]QVI66807.1 OmpA family protein [Cellulomonas fengjieae]